MSRAYRNISKTSLSTLLLSLFFESCTVGPKYKAPVPALAPFHNHSDSSASNGGAATPLDHWWTGFNDPMLATIVERALNQNLDLAAALERVNQARAATAGAAPSSIRRASLVHQRRPKARALRGIWVL